MKSNDIIRPFEKSLLVQFGSTGELQNMSTLRLDHGITFSKDGNAIQAHYHGIGTPFLVERFSRDSLASTGFEHLQTAIKRYVWYRRFVSFSKSTVKWGVAPVILIILALALNTAVTRGVREKMADPRMQGMPMLPLPTDLETSQQLTAPTPALTITSPSELSKAMASGVKARKYSVQLSKGGKGTLYVFSDPACLHCQALEPELDKLSKDYTIHVFPVAVIGGQMSSHRVAKLLCAEPDARAALWKKIIVGDDLQETECANGQLAVAANDQIFRAMRFIGTPTIINTAGEQTPDSIQNTAHAINQWMVDSAARK